MKNRFEVVAKKILQRNLLETSLKLILSVENGFEGDLEVHFTFSDISEFVSRHNAGFLAHTIFGGNFEVRFTFSVYAEFVSWEKIFERLLHDPPPI